MKNISNNISNNANVSELGRKAAEQWTIAGSAGDGGDAIATHALYLAAFTMTFKAEVNRGSKAEPEIEVVEFELADVRNDPRNNDGTVDMKLKSARTVAIAETVFGISELDNAIKQRLGRAVKMALYLWDRYQKEEDFASLVSTRTVKTRHGGRDKMTTCLVVPNEAIYPEPAEDADEEDKARYQQLRRTPKTLNGKDKASLAELGKRANPPKAQRAAGENKTDKGATLLASIAFTRAIVQQNANSDADESEVGLSETLRRELFALAQDIAAYFAVDPMEDENEEEQKQAA
jgi:hypothetical protein